MTPSIKDLSLPALESLFRDMGEPAFRARQVFSWLYRRNASGFDAMTDLNAGLRKRLLERLDADDPRVERLQTSADGTRKFLLRLRDNEAIESVIIPDVKRTTLCVSTQVGCRRGCRLCATAAMGFRRNLTQAEILNQIVAANRLLAKDKSGRITHLVFMGMGEPMDNLDTLLAALAVVRDDYGIGIGPGRITVSTVGVIEGIRRLAREGGGVGLAVSLHAGDDVTRAKLIPLAKKIGISELISAAADYAKSTGDKITFEYVMIKGVNCSADDGKRLGRLLANVPSKLNLIPYNPGRNKEFEPPTPVEIQAFAALILKTGVIVTRRKPRGQDIAAACGQLATS
ncbi:MAG: 23S rRNA (adenine(2503)-C(2))-methyltransferase RlmN [Fibrobacterota bacterium]